MSATSKYRELVQWLAWIVRAGRLRGREIVMAGSVALEQVRELYRIIAPESEELALDELRERYETLLATAPVPDDIDVVAVDANGVAALQVRAPGASSTRTLVWLHSGGYLLGSAQGYRAFGYELSRAADATALLVDYRLAPENPYPAANDDALAATEWALNKGNPNSTVLGGDSAGGALCVATLVSLRDRGGALPAAAVCVSPMLDLAATGESMDTNRDVDPVCSRETVAMLGGTYLGGGDVTNPIASPLYADVSGLPPILLTAGSAETLMDDSVRLAEKVRAAGGEVTLEIAEDMVHIWPLFHSILPEARLSIDRIGAFVRDHSKPA
jgi:epsilon-lactone hydrolase